MKNTQAVPNTVEQKFAYIPQKDERYRQWGHFDKVLKIIKSNQYYPIWITGLSGNGKTVMVEQACAHAGREFIRVNFTLETDENDLIGGMTLVNGDTVFEEGPIVTALRRGSILLLDEIDVGHTNKIMCLQSVLEGKGVLIKATGEYVQAAPGFNVFATSNTKGRGSDDGRFIGTNNMNAAFLDRFAGMIFQDYPPKDIEEFILKSYLIHAVWIRGGRTSKEITEDEKITEAKFITKLCEWAQQIRTSFDAGATSEVITTRALINIIQGYSVLGDRGLAIEMACERFDQASKESFVSMFEKMSDSNFVVSSDDKAKAKTATKTY